MDQGKFSETWWRPNSGTVSCLEEEKKKKKRCIANKIIKIEFVVGLEIVTVELTEHKKIKKKKKRCCFSKEKYWMQENADFNYDYLSF